MASIISPTKYTVPQLETIGSGIIKQVNDEIVTTYEVFPEALVNQFEEDCEETYKTLGRPFLEYLEHFIATNRILMICDSILKGNNKSIADLEHPTFAGNLAITRFHLGDAKPTCYLSQLYAMRYKIPSVNVTIGNIANLRHSFIVLNITTLKFTQVAYKHKGRIINILRDLKESVVVDSTLRVCGPANKIENNSLFMKCIADLKAMQVDSFVQSPPHTEIAKLEKEATLIEGEIRKYMNGHPFRGYEPCHLRGLEFVRQKKYAFEMVLQSIRDRINLMFLFDPYIKFNSKLIDLNNKKVIEYTSNSFDNLQVVNWYLDTCGFEVSSVFTLAKKRKKKPVLTRYQFHLLNHEKNNSAIFLFPTNEVQKCEQGLASYYENPMIIKKIAVIVGAFLSHSYSV